MPSKKLFTLEEANKAVVYVSKVALDIQTAYREAVGLQEQLDVQNDARLSDKTRLAYEESIAKLNRFVDELHELGAELRDYDLGIIDFPAIHDGREISLCWKIGEPQINSWHEVNGGLAGRRDVAQLVRC
jgi:hypothetical protein